MCLCCVTDPSKCSFLIPPGLGYYLYLETSGGSKGYKARLLSPFAPPGKYCIGFWFHMFGQTIATLNVYIQRNETALDLPVWTRTGSSGNQWIEGYVDVVDIYEFRVNLALISFLKLFNTIFIKRIINKSFSMRCPSKNDEKYNHIQGINKEKYTNIITTKLTNLA